MTIIEVQKQQLALINGVWTCSDPYVSKIVNDAAGLVRQDWTEYRANAQEWEARKLAALLGGTVISVPEQQMETGEVY